MYCCSNRGIKTMGTRGTPLSACHWAGDISIADSTTREKVCVS